MEAEAMEAEVMETEVVEAYLIERWSERKPQLGSRLRKLASKASLLGLVGTICSKKGP